MRKLLVLGAAVVFLCAPPLARAATIAVTPGGFVPALLTVNRNDTVVWTNLDATDHQLVLAGKAGISSPVLHAGQSWTFTFTKDGRFTITDALNTSFRAVIVVQRAPAPRPALPKPAPALAVASLSIGTSGLVVLYGETTVLTGQVSTGRAGARVDVLAEPWGENAFRRVATVTTGAGGNWSYAAKPTIRTVYRASVGASSSGEVAIGVHPLVAFHAFGGNRFTTRVTAARSFAGRRVQLQRRSALGAWVTVKRIRLNAHSAASFRASLPGGTSLIRVAISVNQAGAGYLGGFSGAIAYRAT
jgi:hypothetical protein